MQRAAPSPSPPPTPLRLAGLASTRIEKDKNGDQTEQIHAMRAQSTASSELTSLDSRTSTPALPPSSGATSTKTLQTETGAFHYPQYDTSQIAGGKHRSAEYEESLVRFLARDDQLRAWAVGDTPRGSDVNARLQRFSDLTSGPSANSLCLMVVRWRNKYEDVSAKLTASGRATPTKSWASTDLHLLEKFESHSQITSRWFRIWYNSIVLARCRPAASTMKDGSSSSSGQAQFAEANVSSNGRSSIIHIEQLPVTHTQHHL